MRPSYPYYAYPQYRTKSPVGAYGNAPKVPIGERKTATPTAEPNWRPSTSYIPWAELLKRSFDFDVLKCTKCQGRMQIISVITGQDAIDRILSHLSLPQQIEALGSNATLGCDITDEQIPEWEWSQEVIPEPDERGPPSENYGIDPPFSED